MKRVAALKVALVSKRVSPCRLPLGLRHSPYIHDKAGLCHPGYAHRPRCLPIITIRYYFQSELRSYIGYILSPLSGASTTVAISSVPATIRKRRPSPHCRIATASKFRVTPVSIGRRNKPFTYPGYFVH